MVSLKFYSGLSFMKKIFGKVNQYYRDVVSEMRKVVWPTKDEIKDLTIVVLTVSGILALFTFVVDQAISFVMGKLL
jgi:preprotein translocase subunit SecE